MTRVKRLNKTITFAALAALTFILFAPASARAQWTTSGTDISNTNTGNVGVGTTSPTSKLDVTGTAAVSGDLKVGDGRLKFTFSGPEGYVQGATERLSFWTTNGSGGQAVRMRFGGNAATSTAEFLNVNSVLLGTGVRFALGTTSPEGIFDARGGVAASGNGLPIILSAQQGASTGGAGGNVIINSGPNGPSNANGSIIFGVGGTITSGVLTSSEKMRITGAGLVGIGTSAPLQKFQLGTNTPTGTTTPDAISLGATYSSAAGANPKLRLFDDGGTAVYGLGVSDSQFDFIIPTGARYVWSVSGAEKMRLDSAGNFGIGKTAGVGYKLDVNGNVNGAGFCIGGVCKTDWSQVSQWTTSGTTVYYGGGNVGIGTATPGARLDVVQSNASAVRALSGSASAHVNITVGRTSAEATLGVAAGPGHYATAAAAGDVVLRTEDATKKILIANGSGAVLSVSGGKVGIGNSNPQNALDVVGAINATGAITGATVNATYQDVAEWVPSTQKLSAGTVVVLDAGRMNHVLASTSAYDTKVAGVVSERPGIALGEGGEGKVLVATTGRVKVKADATRAPIRVGDLLVTSDVEGVAMRSEPVEIGGRKMHEPGTIIGKALEPLEKGTGEILVLLSLQ